MSRLVVQDGAGTRSVSIGRQMTVGREPDNDLVLHSALASRRRAWIWRQGDRVIVEDLGSTQGTFVNGQRLVPSRFLNHNDVIIMGVVRSAPAASRSKSAEKGPFCPLVFRLPPIH